MHKIVFYYVYNWCYFMFVNPDVRYTEASDEDSGSEADMVEYSSPSQQSPKVSSPVPSDTSFSPSFDFDEENDLNQVASSGESRGKRSREASDRSEEVSRVRKKTKVELLSHKADKKKASRAKFKLAKKKTQPKVNTPCHSLHSRLVSIHLGLRCAPGDLLPLSLSLSLSGSTETHQKRRPEGNGDGRLGRLCGSFFFDSAASATYR